MEQLEDLSGWYNKTPNLKDDCNVEPLGAIMETQADVDRNELKMRNHFLELDNVRLNRELKEANEKVTSLIAAIDNISRHFQ